MAKDPAFRLDQIEDIEPGAFGAWVDGLIEVDETKFYLFNGSLFAKAVMPSRNGGNWGYIWQYYSKGLETWCECDDATVKMIEEHLKKRAEGR